MKLIRPEAAARTSGQTLPHPAKRDSTGGGPLLWFDRNNNAWKIAGVISGFRHEYSPVYRLGDKTKDGKEVRIPTGEEAQTNAGFVFAQNFDKDPEVINNNPIGLPAPQQAPFRPWI